MVCLILEQKFLQRPKVTRPAFSEETPGDGPGQNRDTTRAEQNPFWVQGFVNKNVWDQKRDSEIRLGCFGPDVGSVEPHVRL